jgi:hypothetical protein
MPALTKKSQSQIAAGLITGVQTLSAQETIIFTLYVAIVLPVDQTLFWVLSTEVNGVTLMHNFGAVMPPTKITVTPTSLHHTIETEQREDDTFGRTGIILTTNQEIKDLNQLAPQALYLATIAGVQYSFSKQHAYYDQAGLYHYTGIAVEPAMASQVINDTSYLNELPVVSNSLPYWLSIPTNVPMTYTSFLVPANTKPPYAVIHIEPDHTSAIQALPVIDSLGNPWQLVYDDVIITTYGLRNNEALTYLQDILNWITLNGNQMGLMSMPAVRDMKRTQRELTTLAQKKTIKFRVSYYQTAALEIAQKLIQHATMSYIVEPL